MLMRWTRLAWIAALLQLCRVHASFGSSCLPTERTDLAVEPALACAVCLRESLQSLSEMSAAVLEALQPVNALETARCRTLSGTPIDFCDWWLLSRFSLPKALKASKHVHLISKLRMQARAECVWLNSSAMLRGVCTAQPDSLTLESSAKNGKPPIGESPWSQRGQDRKAWGSDLSILIVLIHSAGPRHSVAHICSCDRLCLAEPPTDSISLPLSA